VVIGVGYGTVIEFLRREEEREKKKFFSSLLARVPLAITKQAGATYFSPCR
jgi:hypothetical protein